MTLFHGTYKDHVQPFYSEEPLDYFLYRPLAYGIVRLTYWLPFNPNHFSFIGLGVAVLSGYFISLGSLESYIIGGFGILVVGVLDCCDGMIARMKKNGSELGELIDMFVDVLSSICFFTGVFISTFKNNFNYSLTIAVIAAATTIIIHVGYNNYYKKQFAYAQKGFFYDKEIDSQKYDRKVVELTRVKGHLFERLLILLYMRFIKIQFNTYRPTSISTHEYIGMQKKILPLWGIISGSSHLTILALSLITNELKTGILVILICGNIWFVFCFFVQRRALKYLEGHN